MRIEKLEYHFLVFLYAYLRQIDLSLDRTRWDSWENLVKYYEEHIPPKKVLEQLIAIEKRITTNSNNISGVFQKGINPIRRFFQSKVSFQKSELLKVIELLEQFNDLLHKEFKEYPKEAELVRVDITKYYSTILGSKMSRKDLKRCMLVEHFFQNENLKTIKIEAFAANI